ncbi:MAG: hypothetical protein LBT14_00080 [Treponema sp.]|jgi:hypothetical protein|nr:hypothetical protein [Treponema sp.]
MKQFIRKALILGALCVPFVFVLPGVLDPYNVFHYKNVRDNGVAPNQNYIKMRYLLDNPGRFDALILGSSKVAPLDVGHINDSLRWYNMTHAWGTPREYFENLQVLIERGIIPSLVLLGIDTASGWLDPDISIRTLGTNPYPTQGSVRYGQFLLGYCNPSVLSSILVSIRHKGNTPEFQKQFYENGGLARKAKTEPAPYNWNNLPYQMVMRFKPRPIEDRIEQGLADIQRIRDLCAEHHIKLIVFTIPLHIAEYQHFIPYGYLDFLEKLADISDFYNFVGINDIAVNNDCFNDVFHHTIATGDMVLDRIFDCIIDEKLLSQGFGYYVTGENRDLLFALLREQLPAHIVQHLPKAE